MTIVKVIMNVSAKRVTFQVPLQLSTPNIIAAEKSLGSIRWSLDDLKKGYYIL